MIKITATKPNDYTRALVFFIPTDCAFPELKIAAQKAALL